MRCQTSAGCENPITHSCDQCGHLVCDLHQQVLFRGLDHDRVVCIDCRPVAPARKRDLWRARFRRTEQDPTNAEPDERVGEPPPSADEVTLEHPRVIADRDVGEYGAEVPGAFEETSVFSTARSQHPERRDPAMRRQSRLTDDLKGPLVILMVLAAIVAVFGGLSHNTFLGLGGGLMSGAALVAFIIVGLIP